MSIAEAKANLFIGMDERRQKHIDAMQGIPMDAIVYPESGWRVQDLLGHLAHFEQITIDQLEAMRRGEPFALDFSMGIDGFNDIDYQLHKHKSAEAMMQLWQNTREALKATLQSLTDEEWYMTTVTNYSQGQAITPEQMAKGMGWHEGQHMKDILALKKV